MTAYLLLHMWFEGEILNGDSNFSGTFLNGPKPQISMTNHIAWYPWLADNIQQKGWANIV